MIRYLRFYYELKHRDLTVLALQSWREHIKGRDRSYNLDVCTRYQQGFINQYRRDYARAKLAAYKQQ